MLETALTIDIAFTVCVCDMRIGLVYSGLEPLGVEPSVVILVTPLYGMLTASCRGAAKLLVVILNTGSRVAALAARQIRRKTTASIIIKISSFSTRVTIPGPH